MTKREFINLNTVELNEHLKTYHSLTGRMESAVTTAIRDERENTLRESESVLADALMTVKMNRLALEIDKWHEDEASVTESSEMVELARARHDGMCRMYRLMNNGQEWRPGKHAKLAEWYNTWVNEYSYWTNLNTHSFSAE